MSDKLPPRYEPWELTAYLLGELEPADTQRISAALASDPQLVSQLNELRGTIEQVKSALSSEPLSTSDEAALAALSQAGAVKVAAETQSSVSRVPIVRRLAGRWENWASLAGLILIAVILIQRNRPAGNELASHAPAESPAQSWIVNGTVPGYEAARVDSLEIPPPAAVTSELAATTGAVASSAPSRAAGADRANMPAPLDAALILAPSPQEPVASTITTSPPSAPANPTEKSLRQLDAYGDMPVDSSQAVVAAESPARADLLARNQMGGMMGGMMGGADLGADVGMGGVSGMGMGGGVGMGGGMGGYVLPGGEGGYPGESFGGEIALSRGFWNEEGRGLLGWPQPSGDRFATLADNPFQEVQQQPLSTFSIDVDTASFSKTRQYLMEYHRLPPPAAVRLEEFINSFDYNYPAPEDEKPFAVALAASTCPWKPEHKLVRIALQAKQVELRQRPQANMVFLLDVSGSMNEPNKLPLVKETIRLLTYQLSENDRVAIVVYAGAAGCVLPTTSGHRQDQILAAIDRLSAGGSTNGGQGIELAYTMARENFVPGGINRVILCTDGDFNVGTTSTEHLVELVQQQAQGNIFLTVLGYGMGNTNDAMMEQIADKGNGLYGFIDSRSEAQRQMVKQLAGNLITVAKDVKVQVEFNPAKVRAYRLLGYENRVMATEDFNNDKKDAGEIGAGHRVTALYEVAMVGSVDQTPTSEPLRYRNNVRSSPAAASSKSEEDNLVDPQTGNELLAVKLRYKEPEGTESQLLVYPLEEKAVRFAEADADFRWSAAMAEFGMLLRNSPHRGAATWRTLLERARQSAGSPLDPARAEALEMIRKASQLMSGQRQR